MTHRINCPGKINLFLDITGKKDNGYHEILTLFLPVSGLEDTITLTDSNELAITCSHPDVPTNSSNLCWKATEAFAESAGISPNWQINIDKKLPVAGGMGGGSSNAGRLLHLLSTVYPDKVSDKKLKEIALSIGADVPFFLNPVPSIASGVGEDLEALKAKKKIPILLISFSFPISAAWAYQNRKLPFNSSGITKKALIENWQNGDISKIIYNDLGFAVENKFPIIQDALEDLKKSGAINAIVSGSGPTVFGVFEHEDARNRALNELIDAGYPKENLIAALAG
ncbi:MAG: 4-(cytidine 5'-diphospho)-2-C-methyl-D-erythritol kinase [Lentisphaeraceae bacterium]|nr:4-(cytidine 5'-diphospho)-2-C-methyl-D-erythritol kinase [Lentisphaeraceae bacterium]